MTDHDPRWRAFIERAHAIDIRSVDEGRSALFVDGVRVDNLDAAAVALNKPDTGAAVGLESLLKVQP